MEYVDFFAYLIMGFTITYAFILLVRKSRKRLRNLFRRKLPAHDFFQMYWIAYDPKYGAWLKRKSWPPGVFLVPHMVDLINFFDEQFLEDDWIMVESKTGIHKNYPSNRLSLTFQEAFNLSKPVVDYSGKHFHLKSEYTFEDGKYYRGGYPVSETWINCQRFTQIHVELTRG